MFNKRKFGFVNAVTAALVTLILAACQPAAQEPQIIEVTRVVTETVVQEGETVEVTRVVTEGKRCRLK